jgi:hypothetical protein
MCLVKAHVRGSTLKKLLDMPIVAEIDLPPAPMFDAVQTGRADKKNFAQPPKPNLDGPRVCVVDSGIAAAHPLLASNVGHEEAILTAATHPPISTVTARGLGRLQSSAASAPATRAGRSARRSCCSAPVGEAKLDKDAVRQVCGHGQVDEELAVTSSDRRVTLVAEGTLKIDHFGILPHL